MQNITTVCGICPSGCGVVVQVEDGRIGKVSPLEGHPQGVVCPWGAASSEIVYSPDRLKTPLKRAGRKGEGRFEPVSWDEAMEYACTRIEELKDKYGAWSIAEYSGRGGWFEQSLKDMFAIKGAGTSVAAKSFLFPLGSPNASGCSSVCYASYGSLAPMTTVGTEMRNLFEDFSNSRLIVVWGANAATGAPPLNLKKILKAKERGARVITIDHFRTRTAEVSDRWIPIRPGTDGALALSMIHVLVRDGLYDKEFVDRWTVGFDELRDYVLEFPPERVQEITRVPAAAIEEVAREIATTRHACFHSYTGLEYSNCGVQSMRALLTLWAITGNLDVPGGNVFRMAPAANPVVCLEPPPSPLPIGADKYPLFHKYCRSAHFMEFPRAVLKGEPYPMKGLIIGGASIMTSYPAPDLWRQVFEALELLIVIDRFMTWDGQYADLILPASSYYEMESHQRYGGHIQLRRQVIEPVGYSRPDYDIYKELADRLGFGETYPAPGEGLLRAALKDSGFTPEELRDHPEGLSFSTPSIIYKKHELGLLRRDGMPGFETPSGKVEIASDVLKEHGYDPLPAYTEPVEGPLGSPELAREYPLVFNSGSRLPPGFRSQHMNMPSIRKLQPEPYVFIHREDAAARGIEDGERVYVVSPRGRVAFSARVTDGILPGVVEVNAGGGGYVQPGPWREANVNLLTDPDNRDPISGFPVYKALLCDVRKVGV